MSNPDIPSALTVLASHLVAAGAALTDPFLDVDRGLPTGARQLRYYWGGEVVPPHMGGDDDTLGSKMVGQRFIIVATWPLSDLSVEQVTATDGEMQTLAGQIRTRIMGNSQLGGNVADLELGYGTPDIVLISGARHIVMRWDLDLAYVEYTKAA